ncbi:hypothetical protein FUA23_13020 [Neolewinella aurantiaca]|uniref:Uncharacterized protein n=1 Tax=Neolewinella aurantiaca TaxID=2602767 RepID=A0A5C7FDL2_9BACT|nr:hypothetical protein [Neolewinella aurantiaca]TXF88767.1 hypothetical protein FUA23_13020 [Neolewinella aurantiaca]
MAKKRFTDDLSGLFEEPDHTPETTRAEAASVRASEPAAPDEKEERVEVDVPTKTSKARRKLSSKGFTADLDAFLSEGFERESTAPSTSSAPAPAPRKSRRRKTGLDLLIRSTVEDEDRTPRGAKAPDTKRVTLIFNKEHLATLKEQARKRGMYLKDVVQEMVEGYLEE